MPRRLSSLFEWWPRCEPCGGGVSFRMPRGLIAEDELAFFFRVYSTTQTIITYAYSPIYGHTYANKLRHSQHTHTHPSMNMQTIASITPLNPEKFAPIGSRTHDIRLAPIGSQTQNLRCYWNFCNHHATDPFAMNWPFWRHSPLNHLKFARY